MKKRNHLIPILLLIFALILSGCSKSADSESAKSTEINNSTSIDSKSDPAIKPDSSTTTDKTDSASVATDDSTNHSAVVSDKSDDAFVKTEDTGSAEAPKESSEAVKDYAPASDVILSESKFSMSDSDFLTGSSEAFLYKDAGSSERGYEGIYDGAVIEDGYYDHDIIIEPIEPEPRIQPKAGVLTAGEWNDNKNFDFLKKLFADGQNFDYKTFFTNWELSPFNRLVILANDASGSPVQGADITVSDGNGNAIWKGVTDHEGKAYAYYGLLDADMMPSKVNASYSGATAEYDVQNEDLLDTSVITMTLDAQKKQKTLDLMFTIDTTGSMGDEIYYLQTELQDVIKTVENDTSNIPLRLSINFYRDHGDDYVIRSNEFSTNINEQLAYLNKEYASGGGDFEEAVEEALEDSIRNHTWNQDSIKLLFLVLDAPPHNTEDIRKSLMSTISAASEMGIRIIPVASSGIDKDTEFLLRAFAMTTGGTYTFLTDDSGVGGDHIEPTVGEYEVEHLNELLVRIIEEYIG